MFDSLKLAISECRSRGETRGVPIFEFVAACQRSSMPLSVTESVMLGQLLVSKAGR